MVLQRTESNLHRQVMGDVTNTRANRGLAPSSKLAGSKSTSSDQSADFQFNSLHGPNPSNDHSVRRRQHALAPDNGGPSSSQDRHPPPAHQSLRRESDGSLHPGSHGSAYPSSPPSYPPQSSSYSDYEVEDMPQTPQRDLQMPQRHSPTPKHVHQYDSRLHTPQQTLRSDSSVPSLPTLPKNKHVSNVSDEEKRQSQASANADDYYSPQREKPLIGPWELGLSLGEGAAGFVRKARHVATGDVVAIKSVNMKKAEGQQTLSIANFQKHMGQPQTRAEKVPLVLQREITIMMMIDHPNIIRLYDVWENKHQLHMVMELVEGGELFTYIRDHDMEEHDCARLYRQIISALQYCHRFQVCHRDLKPENILLDKNHNIKIADFGLAAMYNGKKMRTACGSPHYAAPEVCLCLDYDGPAADAWSAGVVLFAMIFATLPFAPNLDSQKRLPEVIHEVCKAPLLFPANVTTSPELRAFLRRVLQRDPKHRITIAEMWEHEWLKRYDDFAAHPQNRDSWLGGPIPELTTEACGAPFTDESQIDRSIVRSLCLVFNRADEDDFVKILMDQRPNYEQVLYHKLEAFGREHRARLPAFSLPQSTSDYHHFSTGPIQRSNTMASLLSAGISAIAGGPTCSAASETGVLRQTSQFSIVVPPNRGLSAASRATGSAAGTEGSYDPFRSSRTQIAYAGEGYTRVDVARGSSIASKGTSTRSRVHKIRVPSSSAFQSVASASVASFQSSFHDYAYDDQGQVRTLRHTGPQRRTLSISSTTTTASNMTTSSSARFVRSRAYKRSVSFTQRQRMQPPRPSNPTPGSIGQAYLPFKPKKKVVEVLSVNEKPHVFWSHHDMDVIEDEIDRMELEREYQAASRADAIEGDDGRFEGICSSKLVDQSDPFVDSSRTAHSVPNSMQSDGDLSHPAPQADHSERERSTFGAYVDERFGPNLVPVVDDANPTRTSHEAASGRPSSNFYAEYANRDLAEPPFRQPEALTRQRDLHQQLLKLKDMANIAEPGVLDGAMNEIERLMRENAPRITQSNYERRVSSAPAAATTRPASGPGPLAIPIFPIVKRSERDPDQGRRHVSDPCPAYSGAPTIRLVPDNLVPAPLRFKLRPSIVAQNPDGTPMVHAPAMAPDTRTVEARIVPSRKESLQPSGGFSSVPYRPSSAMSVYDSRLDTIEESLDQEDEEPAHKRSSGGKFFRNPFKSNRSSKSLEKENSGPSLHAKTSQPTLRKMSSELTLRPQSAEQALRQKSSQQTLRQSTDLPSVNRAAEQSHLTHRHPVSHPATVELWKSQVQGASSLPPSSQSFAGTYASSEFPHRGEERRAAAPPTLSSKKRDVLKTLFGGDRRSTMTLVPPSVISEGDELSQRRSSRSARTSRDSSRGEVKHIQLLQPGARSLLDEATSWFARVLKGYQPQDVLFPFEVNKNRAMKAIKSVLESWECYGVKDISYIKAEGRMFARLDRMNPIGMKPVHLMIEVFVILDAHRSHNADGLSVARLEKIRGSRRTFKKCGKEMMRLLSARRGLLVTDRARAELMKATAKDVKKLYG